MQRETSQQQQQQQQQRPFLVSHRGRLYDIAPFLAKHPGGVAHLEPYRGASVTSLLEKGHGGGDAGAALVHSEAARYILQEYRLQGDVLKVVNGTNGHSKVPPSNGFITNGFTTNGHSKTNGSSSNGHSKTNGLTHNGVKSSPESADGREENEIENLETLVDWSQPMLRQVGGLGANYERWVNLPVDRPLRLFASPRMERLTKSRWFMVPLVWLPVTAAFLAIHFHGGHSGSSALLGTLLGLVAWTLLEYTLHRWLFHLRPGANPALITLHFLIHGLHHKVPYDHMRLVFPPVPAALIAVLLYGLYSTVLPAPMLFSMGTGTGLGYITYDLFHYYLHFGAPKPSTHMYDMKRYHNRHHFSHHDSGYGITSAFWDNIFGTKIVLQKLAKAIKW